MRSAILLLALVAVTVQAVVLQQPTHSLLETMTMSRHNNFVKLITLANMTDKFDGSDPSETYTIFAPTDHGLNNELQRIGLSMRQLMNDSQLLEDFLNYHVILGSHQRSEFWNNRLFTTLHGAVVRMNHYIHTNNYYVDGAKINNVIYQTKNGMLYTIDHVLNPIKGNIYNTIALDPQLSVLKQAIDTVGLEPFLKDQNPITVFAPTDDAFNLLGAKLNSLMSQPALLKEIIEYHVVYGALYTGGMHTETLHTFEEADQIHLTQIRNQAVVDNARFSAYDISAHNGVIHKIRSVLIPASLKDQI